MIVKLTSLTILFLVSFGSKAQNWEKSFSAGDFDTNGNFLGGSEVMQLVNHKNKLYASVGYWQDASNIWYGGANPSIGWGQIISLPGKNMSWKEDFNLGSSFLRPEVLKQLIFTKDALGNALPVSDTVLITAGYSPNYLSGVVSAKAFVKNDNTGSWEESLIYQGALPSGESYSIRDLMVYTDPITGLENIFLTVGTHGVFVGTYKASLFAKIQWSQIPEIAQLSIRPLSMSIANGDLYLSSGNKIYKRNNGFSPTYTICHEFDDLSININSAVGGVRGLTTVSNPNGVNESLLLMWCPDGQSKGVVYRLDPTASGSFNRVYETKIASLMESYLPGINVNYLLGAYNEFYLYQNSQTNEAYHIVGFESSVTGQCPIWNSYYRGAMFAKRDANFNYSLEEVNGIIGDNDSPLVATRCYVKSPFEDAIYFGGFDPNGNISTNKAWIFKKTMNNLNLNESLEFNNDIKIYPNPVKEDLIIENGSSNLQSFKMVSVLGEILIEGNLNPGLKTIDLSSFAPNVYFIQTQSQSIKFVKTN